MKILPEQEAETSWNSELNFLPVRKAIIFMCRHFSNSGLKDICQTEACNMKIIILVISEGSVPASSSVHTCVLAIHTGVYN